MNLWKRLGASFQAEEKFSISRRWKSPSSALRVRSALDHDSEPSRGDIVAERHTRSLEEAFVLQQIVSLEYEACRPKFMSV